MLGIGKHAKQLAIHIIILQYIKPPDCFVTHLVNILLSAYYMLHKQKRKKEKSKQAAQKGRYSLAKRILEQLRMSTSNTLMSICILTLFQTE